MERWRSFFGNTGDDLWTIIEQAILLAAHDYPREFKERRCLIAEALFAKRSHQGDADATRLSASVVTNCTNRMDIGETRGEDEHVSAHTKEHSTHEAEQHHNEFCSREARNDRVDDHISQVVCNIKETLEDSMQSEAAVLNGLQTLDSLHINVDVLKATEIGKQVNSLRKHPCQEVRVLAKSLVRHWKEVVDDWVNQAGTSHCSWQEGIATSQRDDEEGILVASHDKSTQAAMRLTGDTPQYCYCDGTKPRDNNCQEIPEERGSSSRAELSALGRIEKPQFKSRDAGGKEVLVDDSNEVTGRVTGVKDSSTASLVFGRLTTAVTVGKGSDLSRNHGTAKLSADLCYLSKIQGDSISQEKKQSTPSSSNKQTYACNKAVPFKEKVEVLKRKPQDAYIQVDNAKRHQMTLAMNNLRDLSTPSGVYVKTAIMPGLGPQRYSQSNHARK